MLLKETLSDLTEGGANMNNRYCGGNLCNGNGHSCKVRLQLDIQRTRFYTKNLLEPPAVKW